MTSDKLQQARDYEHSAMSRISQTERPAFHITGNVGWINDPNGFSSFNGEYHLFYQYYPYKNVWGPMHWGHAKTSDFVRWERLPAALAPDMEFDKDGCFSGSAVETPDGKQLLMYTGVRQVIGPSGETEDRQTQCVAFGDGINYEKYMGNPVITGENVPEGGSIRDFRDPKLWYDAEEKAYYSVVGNRPADGSGAILLYRSEDGIHWSYVSTVDACRNEYGRMWECPDFFPLDGEWVLAVSPQEMKQMDYEFHVGHGTMFLTGDFDKKTHTFDRKRVQAIDYGLDFYAPQSLEASDGRRVMIAWMQNWATCHSQPEKVRWFGQMTLPRELKIVDGRIFQNPVRELESFRANPVIHKNVAVSQETTLEGVSGRILDMTVTVRPGDEDGYRKFKLCFAKGGDCFSSVSFRPATGKVRMDRTFSGFAYDIVNNRSFLVDAAEEVKIRVIMDRFSVELFFNDGKQAATMTLYTPQDCDGITFQAEGNVLVDVEKYDLKFDEE